MSLLPPYSLRWPVCWRYCLPVQSLVKYVGHTRCRSTRSEDNSGAWFTEFSQAGSFALQINTQYCHPDYWITTVPYACSVPPFHSSPLRLRFSLVPGLSSANEKFSRQKKHWEIQLLFLQWAYIWINPRLPALLCLFSTARSKISVVSYKTVWPN